MILQGDCLEVMRGLPENSVDSVVTDPPYELGFMGKSWDNTGIAYNVDMWREVIRVLKPGGHLLSFGGTRTYHRMAVAIEDAGFEIRDMIEWVYGSGFPKSLNIGLAIDKKDGIIGNRGTAFRTAGAGDRKDIQNKNGKAGMAYTDAQNEYKGWGTALKPAHEPICMARKPLAEKTVAENVLKYGTGGIDIDGSRVESNEELGRTNNPSEARTIHQLNSLSKERITIDNSNGKRFPANLIHDNSEEVRECFPENKSSNAIRKNNGKLDDKTFGKYNAVDSFGFNDSGNASRFFKSIIYQAKASKSERNKGLEESEGKYMDEGREVGSPGGTNPRNRGAESKRQNFHPTVKPIALMEYLIKMVTPKGGIVLDPFAGSGSTLVAAKQSGYQFIGIEKEEEYIKIIEARIDNTQKQVDSKLL